MKSSDIELFIKEMDQNHGLKFTKHNSKNLDTDIHKLIFEQPLNQNEESEYKIR